MSSRLLKSSSSGAVDTNNNNSGRRSPQPTNVVASTTNYNTMPSTPPDEERGGGGPVNSTGSRGGGNPKSGNLMERFSLKNFAMRGSASQQNLFTYGDEPFLGAARVGGGSGASPTTPTTSSPSHSYGATTRPGHTRFRIVGGAGGAVGSRNFHHTMTSSLPPQPTANGDAPSARFTSEEATNHFYDDLYIAPSSPQSRKQNQQQQHKRTTNSFTPSPSSSTTTAVVNVDEGGVGSGGLYNRRTESEYSMRTAVGVEEYENEEVQGQHDQHDKNAPAPVVGGNQTARMLAAEALSNRGGGGGVRNNSSKQHHHHHHDQYFNINGDDGTTTTTTTTTKDSRDEVSRGDGGGDLSRPLMREVEEGEGEEGNDAINKDMERRYEEADDDEEEYGVEEYEEDEDEDEDEEGDFGDETFKLVADDINVNVDALLSKLRQADTFDRRETMLKKGNVKNANILQVEMFDDQQETDTEDYTTESESESESEHEQQHNTNDSAHRIVGDPSSQTPAAKKPQQPYNNAANTTQREAAEDYDEYHDNNDNKVDDEEEDEIPQAASPFAKLRDVDGERLRLGLKQKTSAATGDAEDNVHDNNEDEEEDNEEKNENTEKELLFPRKDDKSTTKKKIQKSGDTTEHDVLRSDYLQTTPQTRASAASSVGFHHHPNQRSSLSTTRKSFNRFDGRESEEMSASTFRDDASHVSFFSDGTRKPRSALKKSKNGAAKQRKKRASVGAGGDGSPSLDVPANNIGKKSQKSVGFGAGGGKDGGRGGVSFSQNVVSEVCIFEVGDDIYVGVQFKRSWVGWVAAFLAVVFETIFDVHVVYLYLTTPYPIGAVQAWVGTSRFLISAILFLVAFFAGVGVQPLKHVLSGYGILILSIMALCLAVAVSLEAVVVEVTEATHFFVASVLYCLWIVLYRLFIKEAVFLLEVIAILVTVAGFIVSNMTYETSMTVKSAITGNVVIFISSVLYAAYFFLLSRVRKWAPIVPMATFQGIYAVLIALPLAAILKVSASDMFAFVSNGTLFGHALVISVEGVISNLLLILTIDYLDVLSVASIFILKSAAMPVFSKLIILDNFDIDPDKKAQLEDIEMTWYLYLGYILAIIGCITTVVFASLRRSFVMRRIASTKRKKAPNPYTKKKRKLEREAAAKGITVEELQAQQAQLQQAQLEHYQQFLLQQQQHQQQHQDQQQYAAAYQHGNVTYDDMYGNHYGGVGSEDQLNLNYAAGTQPYLSSSSSASPSSATYHQQQQQQHYHQHHHGGSLSHHQQQQQPRQGRTSSAAGGRRSTSSGTATTNRHGRRPSPALRK